MGRHSAPDAADEDADLAATVDAGRVGGGSAAAVATAPTAGVEPAGKHSRRGLLRPRPAPEAAAGSAVEEPGADADAHGPPPDGLSLLDDAFGSDPHADVDPDVGVDSRPGKAGTAELLPGEARAAADAPTTQIPLAELARDDRPVPEETTAKIAVVAPDPVDAPVAEPSAPLPSATPPPPPATTPADATPVAPTPAAATPAASAPAATTETATTPPATNPPAAAPATRGGHGTDSDLALIRRHGDVRARVIAAIVVPFAAFVAFFAVPGNLEVHSLVWIWIPAVVAGVLVGFLLDAGHKRYAGDRTS